MSMSWRLDGESRSLYLLKRYLLLHQDIWQSGVRRSVKTILWWKMRVCMHIFIPLNQKSNSILKVQLKYKLHIYKNFFSREKVFFSTGVGYMYSSLFKVSQWCNAIFFISNPYGVMPFTYWEKGIFFFSFFVYALAPIPHLQECQHCFIQYSHHQMKSSKGLILLFFYLFNIN